MRVKTPEDFIKAYKKHGSIKAVARNEDVSYFVAHRLYVKAVNEELMDPLRPGAKNKQTLMDPGSDMVIPEPVMEGKVYPLGASVFQMPKKGKVKRYILTCAQNNTKIHEPLWNNMEALADHYDAEIIVSRFTYMRSGINKGGDKRQITGRGDNDLREERFTWDDRLTPHILDDRAEIAPGLMWCGEMNILPTAVRPLSGLESYTGRLSAVFPHVKLAMQSIASGQNDPTKFNYTTGTVTLRNYIQKKAGMKAEFHHCYGALLVEVDSDGDWFVRQINADSSGTFYDLDLKVENGQVTEGHRLEAILWGDVHVEDIDVTVERVCWYADGILETLRPKLQFLGDILDFRSRTHHEIKDPHLMFKKFAQGRECVRTEVNDAANFISEVERTWCKTVVVDSNHHNHLERWLKEQNGLKDPVNAQFWLALNKDIYTLLCAGVPYNVFKEAMALCKGRAFFQEDTIFLDEDQSYVICEEHGGGVECGMHGDLGPSGSRGSPISFAKMGRRANVGHSHSAGITDGVYVAGCCSNLSPDWTKGPSSWSHSHVLTYENGKRTILTMWNGKWRA